MTYEPLCRVCGREVEPNESLLDWVPIGPFKRLGGRNAVLCPDCAKDVGLGPKARRPYGRITNQRLHELAAEVREAERELMDR